MEAQLAGLIFSQESYSKYSPRAFRQFCSLFFRSFVRSFVRLLSLLLFSIFKQYFLIHTLQKIVARAHVSTPTRTNLFYCLFFSDINECLNSTLFSCPGRFRVCKNTPGSYMCECQQGLLYINNTCQGEFAIPNT